MFNDNFKDRIVFTVVLYNPAKKSDVQCNPDKRSRPVGNLGYLLWQDLDNLAQSEVKVIVFYLFPEEWTLAEVNNIYLN